MKEQKAYPRQSENDLLGQILQLARLKKWKKIAHFRPARIVDREGNTSWRTAVSGDGAGFPDLVLVRRYRLIFAEVKSEKGVLSPLQEEWVEALKQTVVEVYVWRPSDWDEIVETLE